MTNENLTNDQKLRYLQTKIHEITLECVNTYMLAPQKESLFHTFLSTVFMSFRDSVDTSISDSHRYKSLRSFIDNIEKEVLKKLNNQLPESYTTSDIDSLVPEVVKSVCKDFLGATIVFHSKNNLSNYCEQSNNPYIQKLYKQVLIIEAYLRSSDENQKYSSLFSAIRNHFKTIDISSTFIDDDKNPLAPTKLKPLHIKNIRTKEDYYTNLINLLTLLTNASLPCTESTDGKTHKYCVSELDIPYLQLVKQAKSQNPKNRDEYIRILTQLAHQAYYRKYTSFDEQLEEAISQQNIAKKQASYKTKLSSKEKLKYIQELTNLKNNLQQMKNDRLLNHVLSLELPPIFDKLSKLPDLHVKVKSHKQRAKSDGFYACYYTIELNGIVICEVLGHSEFRSMLSKEGNAAHNLMSKKSFDIKHLFELRENPLDNSPTAQEQLNFYLDFLSTVSLNDVSGYHISPEDKDALKDLQNLVNYAMSKIKVKDFITVQNGKDTTKVPFYDYITSVLSVYGAEYGSIYPAHIIEHNQALLVPQSPLYSLENLLKSRVGFSTLANMIREKYIKITTIDKKEKILPHSLAQTYSSTLTPKYELPIDNLKAKEANENFGPLDIPFRTMGEKADDSDSR